MDINPDEAIAMGLVRPYSLSARFMECMNREVLKSAKAVITLDSYMERRIKLKLPFDKCISVVPPWPHEDIITKTMGRGLGFRKKHGLDDKFVVMYSGNHSWVHPLDTLLDAAGKLLHRADILFLFIGGGVEKKKVERAIQSGAPNIRSLPYQSFENLGESLSAADVHVVVMGEAMVGIVHPCKIYGAMTVRRPLLAIAPDSSHISEIIDGRGIGFRFHHGDVNGVVQAILTLADMDKSKRTRMGDKAGALVRTHWNQTVLRQKIVDILERSAD
jgi:glycosyltransferase involved in cell wall biosynthesis